MIRGFNPLVWDEGPATEKHEHPLDGRIWSVAVCVDYYFCVDGRVSTPKGCVVTSHLVASLDDLLVLLPKLDELIALRICRPAEATRTSRSSWETVQNLQVTRDVESEETGHGGWVTTMDGEEYALHLPDIKTARARCYIHVIRARSKPTIVGPRGGW